MDSRRSAPPAPPTAEPVELTAAREPRVGDMVGPYPILGELGRGGMAVVYRSKDPALPREVALKIVLPRAIESDGQAKARFLREAGAQARVDHPHVVPIYHAGEWNGVPYFVMPALKGRTLGALLAEHRESKKPLPAAEVLRIGREIAEGLEAAHAVGLVHRDIKPSNVWLEDPKGWVKILDFGLAHEEVETRADLSVTQRKALIGTPSYMSPEQAASQPVDARTDLWSLGVVLYQMATGDKPFAGTTRPKLLQAIADDPPPPINRPDLPPGLRDVIFKLLAKDPDDRFPTAGAVVEALAAVEKVQNLPTAVPVPAAATVAVPVQVPVAAPSA
ncbi:MAG: serine/threonine protein kinase, partial [Gemmataceae bacterium]|nr:serine/threonine protein kinase [Gemmataceae bacterium]